jgi:PLP dependent protein
MNPVVENRASILARIAAARKQAVMPAPATTLIAVSKMHGEEPIRALLDAGQRDFGENRVQEAEAKWTGLKRAAPDTVLHLIGPLQTNKVREAVALFDVIQSLDRPKLLHALKAECERTGKHPRLFVQVNVGEEPQKAGIFPREAPAFLALARDAFGDQLQGLMCIPPQNAAPAPFFALLKKLAKDAGLAQLSMGMSDDFETAVQFGATFVRVGSAIFGARPSASPPRETN